MFFVLLDGRRTMLMTCSKGGLLSITAPLPILLTVSGLQHMTKRKGIVFSPFLYWRLSPVMMFVFRLFSGAVSKFLYLRAN